MQAYYAYYGGWPMYQPQQAPPPQPQPQPQLPSPIVQYGQQVGQQVADYARDRLPQQLGQGVPFLGTALAIGNAAMPILARANKGSISYTSADNRLASNLRRILGR